MARLTETQLATIALKLQERTLSCFPKEAEEAPASESATPEDARVAKVQQALIDGEDWGGARDAVFRLMNAVMGVTFKKGALDPSDLVLVPGAVVVMENDYCNECDTNREAYNLSEPILVTGVESDNDADGRQAGDECERNDYLPRRECCVRETGMRPATLDEIKALLPDNNIQEWITGNMIIL
jgi:hypothetical protein